MPKIVPHSESHGVDFCSMNGKFYIVRPDIGYYMTTPNLHENKDIEVLELHGSCKIGKHYLANNGYFYIIKDTEYRRVTDMSRDEKSVVYELHPNCRKGDYYLSMGGKFYIIFKEKGVYRRTTNMNNDADAVEYTLHPGCKDGLYYWGNGSRAYFLKPTDDWGVEYHETSNMNHDSNAKIYSFAKDVVSFLPGGIAKTTGIAFARWELVKSFKNSGETEIEWSEEVSHRKGANRSQLSSIEHNWKVNASSSSSAGKLMESIAKWHFKLDAQYGGKRVETTTENWEEATTVTEKIVVPIPAGESIFLWQYRLGLGEKNILFCRDMCTTKSSKPPQKILLKTVEYK